MYGRWTEKVFARLERREHHMSSARIVLRVLYVSIVLGLGLYWSGTQCADQAGSLQTGHRSAMLPTPAF